MMGIVFTSFAVLIVITLVLLMIYYLSQRFIKNHLIPYKYSQPESFETLLSILQAMIELELSSYEKDIFARREGLTNSNFNNYYEDMCNTISDHIADNFMMNITKYVTEEFVYTLIARKVKAYLVSKIGEW